MFTTQQGSLTAVLRCQAGVALSILIYRNPPFPGANIFVPEKLMWHRLPKVRDWTLKIHGCWAALPRCWIAAGFCLSSERWLSWVSAGPVMEKAPLLALGSRTCCRSHDA